METVKYYINVSSVDRSSPLTLDVVKLVGMETEKYTITIGVAMETSCYGKSLSEWLRPLPLHYKDEIKCCHGN